MTVNKGNEITFNNSLMIFGLIALIMISLITIIASLNAKPVELLPIIVFGFFMIYGLVMHRFTIKKIEFNQKLVIYRSSMVVEIENVKEVSLIKFSGYGLFRVTSSKNSKKIVGLYIKLYDEHKEITELLQSNGIPVTQKRIWL